MPGGGTPPAAGHTPSHLCPPPGRLPPPVLPRGVRLPSSRVYRSRGAAVADRCRSLPPTTPPSGELSQRHWELREGQIPRHGGVRSQTSHTAVNLRPWLLEPRKEKGPLFSTLPAESGAATAARADIDPGSQRHGNRALASDSPRPRPRHFDLPEPRFPFPKKGVNFLGI